MTTNDSSVKIRVVICMGARMAAGEGSKDHKDQSAIVYSLGVNFSQINSYLLLYRIVVSGFDSS